MPVSPHQALQQPLAGARELLNVLQGAKQCRLAGLKQFPCLGRRLLGIATGAAELAQRLAEIWTRGCTFALQGGGEAVHFAQAAPCFPQGVGQVVAGEFVGVDQAGL
jgi:hypothetical protein